MYESTYVDDKTWREIVPDVRTMRGGEPEWAWLTPAQSHARGTLEQTCKAIADWLTEWAAEQPVRDCLKLPTRPIGVRNLPPLGTRATNAVYRNFVGHDLGGVAAADIAPLRNVGRLTVLEIVAAIVQAAVQDKVESLDAPWSGSNLPSWDPHQVFSDFDVKTTSEEVGGTGVLPGVMQLDPRHEAMLEDVLTVARWQLTRGEGLDSLFSRLTDDPVPEEVVAAQERLLNVRAVDLLDKVDAPDAAKALDVMFSMMDERDLSILQGRFLSLDKPRTLDDLGGQLGVTRERIRQLEAKAVARLREEMAFGGPVGDFLAVLRAEIKSVVPLADLISRHPNLRNEVATVGLPLWFVLDRIDDAFEVQDDWAAAPTVSDAKRKTQQALEDLDNRYGLVRLDELGQRLGHEMSPEDLASWVRYCGYAVPEGHVLIRTAIPDRAIAALALENRPMTSAEISAHVPDRSSASVKNALTTDDRVHRVDRDTWALVEWGHESYSGIRDMIGRVLDRSNGRIQLADLTDELTSRFDVSPNSVLAYASSPPYSVSTGWVSRTSEERVTRKTPGETRRLYRAHHGWKYRIEVNDDHLRGSGFPVPRGVVDLVKCGRGESVSLLAEAGSVVLRWTGLQPSCGSIRSSLEALGARSGDLAFLHIVPETQHAHVELVRDVIEGDTTDRLRLLCGLPRDRPHGQNAVDEMAQALDLPPGSDAIAVASRLRDRGERDLFELALQVLPTRPAPTVAVTPDVSHETPSDAELMSLFGLG